MCGIAAIYSYHYAAPEIDREELGRIITYMAPRGPDGEGTWFSADGRVSLGHRRLSIIDLSDRAAQPMTTADGKLVISYNGEIYNYKELRRRLLEKGHVFQSHSDTEVLLHLYAEKGKDMLHDLRGMFAFALWDQNKRTMLLARDPYGIKPLYYADDGWTLRVASQVKALQAGGKVSCAIEPAGIAGFFLFGSVPEPYTQYLEIRAVPAGSSLWIDDLGPGSPQSYFSIAKVFRDAAENPSESTDAEFQEVVRDALLDSVSHHLVADVPVGAFLSAGVDSGSLVGLMKDCGQQDIQTVTLAFEEFWGHPEDEAPLAEKVALRYGTNHTTRVVTEIEFQQDIPRILEAMDQPSIDGINTWFVSKAARELGLKVAISGLGGDELFGGYPSFRDIPRSVRVMAIPSRIPLLGDIARLVLTPLLSKNGRSPKLAGLFKYGGSYAGAYLLRRGLFMPWELSELMGPELAAEGLRRLSPLQYIEGAMKPDPKSPYARVAALEASLYMRNQLLRDADWAGMAHSLEIRVPLVDTVLLKSLSPVVGKQGRTRAKELIGLSPTVPLDLQIRSRMKTGFTVPVQEWLENLGSVFDTWRRVPELSRDGCHWARRLAYSLQFETTS